MFMNFLENEQNEIAQSKDPIQILIFWLRSPASHAAQQKSEALKWQKKFSRDLTAFSCLLDKRITEISKKLNSHGGFLRAELVSAKTSCLLGQMGLAVQMVAQKATVRIQFL